MSHRFGKQVIFAVVIALHCLPAQANTPLTLVLPYVENESQKNRYLEAVIVAAMAQVGVAATIEHYSLPANQTRLQRMLESGEGINVAWMPVTEERLGLLPYVPVALYGGLHGNRAFLIHRDRQAEFDNITSLQELSKLVALQNKHWSEFRVLQSNGLEVSGELRYSNMFRALTKGLGDYFPRSVLTIEKELAEHPDDQLAIEQKLILVYPAYYAFFVAATQTSLHQQLNEGLNLLVHSGELKRLFNSHYSVAIDGLELSSRRKIALKNPDFSTDKQKLFITDWVFK